MAENRFYKFAIPLWLGTAFSLYGDTTVYTILPLYIEQAGITLTEAGILMGINRLVRLVFNVISGYLYDIGNSKKLFISYLTAGAVSTLMFGLFSGFWPLFAARVIWGIAWSGIIIGGTTMLLQHSDPASKGKWIGVHHSWMMSGSALWAVMGAFLAEKIGFHASMTIGCVLSFICTFVVFLMLPKTEQSLIQTSTDGKPTLGITVTKKKKLSFAVIKGFDKKLYLTGAVICMSRFIFSGFVISLVSVIVKEKISPFFIAIGVSALAGIVSSGKTVVGIIVSPIIGFLSDKSKNRWQIIIVILLLGTAGLFLLTLPAPFFTLLGLFLCAIPASSLLVLTRTFVSDHYWGRDIQGQAVGFIYTAGDLGSAVGPPLALYLLSHISLGFMFTVSAIVLFTFTAFVFFAVRKW